MFHLYTTQIQLIDLIFIENTFINYIRISFYGFNLIKMIILQRKNVFFFFFLTKQQATQWRRVTNTNESDSLVCNPRTIFFLFYFLICALLPIRPDIINHKGGK